LTRAAGSSSVAAAFVMLHPLERWFDASLTPLFRASFVLSLVVMAVLGAVDADLHVPTAPQGIVSFEFAGADGAGPLLAGWTQAQRRDAIFVQGLDYLFLIVYSTALASAALLLGRRHAAARPRLASLARPAAWGLTGAALADAVENTPLTIMLRTGVPDPTGATISLAFASAKFVLLALGIGFVLVASLAPRRPSSQTPS
jgi:hypothetical protein